MALRLALLVALACTWVTSAHNRPTGLQQPQGFAFTIIGVGSSSCGLWSDARAKESPQDRRAFELKTWVGGYLTAYNLLRETSIMRTDSAGMDAFFDKYCADKPTTMFLSAVNAFIIDQGGRLK